MKFDVTIHEGKIQSGGDELRAHIRSRRDGAYRVEIKRAGEFTGTQRALAHIWMRQIEDETGVSVELQKVEYCKALGWGEPRTMQIPYADGEVMSVTVFVRRSTEEMDAETYRQLMDRIRYAADFCGVRLETP